MHMVSQLFRSVHHKHLQNSTLFKQNLMDVGVYNLPSDAREKPRGLAREWEVGLTSKMRLGGRKMVDVQDCVYSACVFCELARAFFRLSVASLPELPDRAFPSIRARGSMLALIQRSYISSNDSVMVRTQDLDFQPVIEVLGKLPD